MKMLLAGGALMAVVAASWMGVPAEASSAEASSQAPPVLTDSLAGRDSFDRYCAPCHGDAGRGDGPVAPALRARPADLTTLARRNGGAFPAARVREFIVGAGRAVPSHGTTEMPVWGPMFRAFESDARARERVENLVTHLASIQVPSTGPQDAGSQLFRTYCASCHGVDARGSGPVAEHLRQAPPDLTQYTRRNGGVFPSARLAEVVDGRHVPTHGTREMPVWGDAFRAVPGSGGAATVKARIGAILRYLEGIQERAG